MKKINEKNLNNFVLECQSRGTNPLTTLEFLLELYPEKQEVILATIKSLDKSLV
jgi:hypothetical protein